MLSKEVSIVPFKDQRPGTSGLRKKTKAFMAPHYVESFVQSVFNALKSDAGETFKNKTLVVGGDGRFYNDEAIQKIIAVAVANGFGEILVGCGGVVSTPAVSAIIRENKAFGGFVLSASHNPGGIDEDFGIKYNISNGGPAPAVITEKIFDISKTLDKYLIAENVNVDISACGIFQVGDCRVKVIDPLEDYTNVMQRLFDFDLLKDFFKSGFSMRFDAMNAATGPYAKHIFEHLLGAPVGTVMRGVPLQDFGGAHPDPNQVHAKELIACMSSSVSPDLGAASDGDGDRNLILGKDFYVTPGDSVAVIAEYASSVIPGYKDKVFGLARSMPTSMALDRVADALGVPCYETPTGWKYFGNLMDGGKCTICGEESFGTGSDHVREKDGIWAVLCWISILASTKKTVQQIVEDHWRKFGRSYFQRHDYESLNATLAGEMMEELRAKLPALSGQKFGGQTIRMADDFCYLDPIDGSSSTGQGIRILLDNGSRAVFRLSGTGTQGATLRAYYESYDKTNVVDDPYKVLSLLVSDARRLLKLQERFGVNDPDVIT